MSSTNIYCKEKEDLNIHIQNNEKWTKQVNIPLIYVNSASVNNEKTFDIKMSRRTLAVRCDLNHRFEINLKIIWP